MALLTRKDLAEKIGKTPNTIWRYEKDGRAPVQPIKMEYNGEVRYPEDAVEAYLAWMNRQRG